MNATKNPHSPLLYPAVFLSLASLAWTTWSLVDLLGTGWIGFTVAAGSDIVWGSVIIAEARGLRIAGRSWVVPALGWATLLIVAVFLASHGIARDSIAMAAAGPFLPFGAKVVWALALADMRDPAALTHDELHKLAGMERGMVFEEAEHDIRMRQQRMRAELLMSEVSTDFDIEVMRQDRVRDLRRRAPLALTANTPAEPNTTPANTEPEPFASTPNPIANTTPSTANTIREHVANKAFTSPNSVPQPARPNVNPSTPNSELPSIADLVREQIANTPDNPTAVRNVMTARPDANRDSVAAQVRRARRKEMEGGYG